MDQSEVSGGWTSIYQLFWCILVFTEGTKVSKAIILFAFLGPCKYAVRWRKKQMLAAWQLQVTSSMSAGWPFSTGLSGRPVSSTRIWVLWNQHCAFPATFFATTALLWKKRQNSFKMIQANPGNPSWYWSEVMVHKERERERRHDGKKMEQSWK